VLSTLLPAAFGLTLMVVVLVVAELIARWLARPPSA
jgi:hypothetical protein